MNTPTPRQADAPTSSATLFHDLFSLEGRTALVTGASSGLGRHFASTLARAGARVVVTARHVDRLDAVVDAIQAHGGRASALALDVSDAASVRTAFDTAERVAGPIDIIVNNAGISVDKRFLDQQESDWDTVIDTNLKGAWLVAQEGAKRLVDREQPGVIVNIASILGERVAGNVAPYAISKAGLIQASKAMALELARYGIRVNALLPGYVATDLNRAFLESEAGSRLRARVPTRHFGELSGLDGPLLLLVSDAGAHITGATLAVDGGHLVSSL